MWNQYLLSLFKITLFKYRSSNIYYISWPWKPWTDLHMHYNFLILCTFKNNFWNCDKWFLNGFLPRVQEGVSVCGKVLRFLFMWWHHFNNFWRRNQVKYLIMGVVINLAIVKPQENGCFIFGVTPSWIKSGFVTTVLAISFNFKWYSPC